MINDDLSLGSRKQRSQSNFDERLFLEYIRHPESVSFLECQAPERSPQQCERFTTPELKPVSATDNEGHQVIISEISTIGDIRSRLRLLKDRCNKLREEYRAEIREKWTQLLRQYPKTVTYYRKSRTTAFRKAKWRKIPTGQSKVVVKYVYLKPRLRHVVRRGVDFGMILVRPRVRRELIVPVYHRVVDRPAGFRSVTVRTKVTRQTYDFGRIRPLYVVYKVERRALLDETLAPILAQIEDLYKVARTRMSLPHRLIAYSTMGWIPPSWEEYYYQHYRAIGAYEEVYGHILPIHFTTAVLANAGLITQHFCLSNMFVYPAFMGYSSLASNNLGTLLETVRNLSTDIPFSVPESYRLKDMLHPKTVVDRLVWLDSTLNADLRDEQNEALAETNVRSLRNGSDYVFNLPRSIGELKDSKQTFGQAADFLRWLARGTRGRQALPFMAKQAGSRVLESTGSASLAVVGAFLAWKFAIQPTIQDCVTLRDHSSEWILATRRQLMESIAILKKSSSNILHVRAKFRGDDAVRQKSLKNIVEDVVPREEIVELSSWTRFDPPLITPVKLTANVYDTEFSHENEVIEGFEPSYRMADSSLYGSARQTPDYAQALYTLTGCIAHGAVSGQVDVGDPGVKPESFASDERQIDVHDGPVTEFIGMGLPSNVNQTQRDVLERAEWPRVNTSGYVKNQVEGVVFARYQLQDLLEFLDYDNQNNSLMTLQRLLDKMAHWADLLDASYRATSKDTTSMSEYLDEAARVNASFDSLYVAWQLTPLSFVYDWMTTSDSIVQRLNNFLTEYSVPAPPAMDGIWVTKRVELLAGRPKLELDPTERLSSSYVSDWYGGKMTSVCAGRSTPSDPRIELAASRYWAFPKRVVTTHRLRYVSDSKVSLTRSGLYAVKRGEYISGGWETFLPQIRIKLNANKIGTLLGILAGFLAPKQ